MGAHVQELRQTTYQGWLDGHAHAYGNTHTYMCAHSFYTHIYICTKECKAESVYMQTMMERWRNVRDREVANCRAELAEAERALESSESEAQRWRSAEEAARKRLVALENASQTVGSAHQQRREKVADRRYVAREHASVRNMLRMWSDTVGAKGQWMRGIVALRGRAERTQARNVMRAWSSLAQWRARGGKELTTKSGAKRHLDSDVRIIVYVWRSAAARTRSLAKVVEYGDTARGKMLLLQTFQELHKLRAASRFREMSALALTQKRPARVFMSCFRTWSYVTRNARRLLVSRTRLGKAVIRSLLLVTWREWFAYNQTQLSVRKMALLHFNRGMMRMLNIWQEISARQVELHEYVSALQEKRQIARKRGIMRAWMVVAERRHLRRSANDKAAYAKITLMIECCAWWQRCVTRNKWLRRCKSKIASVRNNKALSASFLAWASDVREKRRIGRINRRVEVKRLVKWLGSWRADTVRTTESAFMQKEWEKEKEGLVCERDKLREGLAGLQDALKISTSVNRCVGCMRAYMWRYIYMKS
jgi:hypothetical protein